MTNPKNFSAPDNPVRIAEAMDRTEPAPASSPTTSPTVARRSWATHTAFRAVCNQEVLAPTEEKAKRIAADSVYRRSFTSDVEIVRIEVKEWTSKLAPSPEDYAELSAPPSVLPIPTAPEIDALIDAFEAEVERITENRSKARYNGGEWERADRSALREAFRTMQANRDKVLNALIDCGVQAGGYAIADAVTIEVPKAVHALRSEVARLTEERDRWERVAKGWKYETEVRDAQLRRISATGGPKE